MSVLSRPVLFLLFTLVAALTLTILPMPSWASDFRPQWVTLILIYWCLVRPNRIGVFSGFSLGIAQDLVSGALLGEHALSLSVVAYLAGELHRRIRAFPLSQQAVAVWLLLLIERLLSLWILGATGQPTPTLAYWLPTLVGLLLWPWFSLLLDRLRLSARLA
ncbi:rod shape-determining protein MreD [Halochromatium roseum]|uniref:rod shape-determining protein MreD n=1 Tax=Halochromatium roseum TaxID=391920 RepID=UPI0019147152|nr:rod shape-determining protein MreD [Halochromatium roseum]MBK5939677.1 rod shape-determining protein MreD [Halochromatium roseum]